MSRVKNTKRNIYISGLYTIVTLGSQFIIRTVIVRYLGSTYLGLSSLFTSILQVLSMAELGFSNAIIFNLYKPVADNDIEKVNALLNYYKIIYRYVGILVTLIGLLIAPFISYFVHDELPKNINIYILYGLYLLNSGVSYFLFAYKSALLEAMQRMDLVKLIYTLVSLFQYAFQIISIVVFKNFYGFVIGTILCTILKNLFSEYVSKKYYPQYICKGKIEEQQKKDILSRVKGLLICNISNVTYTTFDSIILSFFLGLHMVAIYNNYITIYTGVVTCVNLIRMAMQASVGNSVAKESVEKNYNDMMLWQYLFSMITVFIVTCLISTIQPVMKLWMGEDMMLPMIDVIMIVSWVALTIVQYSFYLYLSGNGYWWELRMPYIFSTICNLIMNVLLCKVIGISGIIIASVISSIVFCSIWQCHILFRVYFKKSMKNFLIIQLYYFGIMIFSSLLSNFMCSLCNMGGVIGIMLKVIICLVVSITSIFVLTSKMKIYSQAKIFVKRVINT